MGLHGAWRHRAGRRALAGVREIQVATWSRRLREVRWDSRRLEGPRFSPDLPSHLRRPRCLHAPGDVDRDRAGPDRLLPTEVGSRLAHCRANPLPIANFADHRERDAVSHTIALVHGRRRTGELSNAPWERTGTFELLSFPPICGWSQRHRGWCLPTRSRLIDRGQPNASEIERLTPPPS